MTLGEWFWWLLTVACLAWYSTITVYVAVKGGFDVREMLARLAEDSDKPEDFLP